MKWDNTSIAVWFFYRASIPTDIIQNAPDPSGWGLPAAELMNTQCNIQSHFIGHQIVFGECREKTILATDLMLLFVAQI